MINDQRAAVAQAVEPLVPLSQYEAPGLPNEHLVRQTWRRIRQRFFDRDDEPMLEGGSLRPTSLKTLDGAVEPPACGPTLVDLRSALAPWIAERNPATWLQVVVVPPCDRGDVLRAWGIADGHIVLPPPDRAALLDGTVAPLPGLAEGTGVLVVPRLEDWFLRRHDGLQAVRSLLAALTKLDRRCVIGCNSWAWAFLCKAAGADLLLPPARTFKAFGPERLQAWFAELGVDDRQRQVTFRLAGTGRDVLEKDQEGRLKNNYLRDLAARSLGIPGVAWHLWRAALRTPSDVGQMSEKATEASGNDHRTIWVAAPDDRQLPVGHEEQSLLVLHALLLHDSLTPEELADVLPAQGEADVVPALLALGFVQREGDRLRVAAGAYPTIRDALKADGLPVGSM